MECVCCAVSVHQGVVLVIQQGGVNHDLKIEGGSTNRIEVCRSSQSAMVEGPTTEPGPKPMVEPRPDDREDVRRSKGRATMRFRADARGNVRRSSDNLFVVHITRKPKSLQRFMECDGALYPTPYTSPTNAPRLPPAPNVRARQLCLLTITKTTEVA